VACICAFQKALSGVFPPNKSAGSECPMCSTSQVHEAFLRAIFRPSRAPALCSCQAAGASRSQHSLSSFLLHMANYGSRRRMVRLKFLFKPSEASACGGFKSAVVLQLDLPGGQKWALAETACCDQTASARPLIRHVEKTKCPLQRTTTLINTLLSFFFFTFSCSSNSSKDRVLLNTFSGWCSTEKSHWRRNALVSRGRDRHGPWCQHSANIPSYEK